MTKIMHKSAPFQEVFFPIRYKTIRNFAKSFQIKNIKQRLRMQWIYTTLYIYVANLLRSDMQQQIPHSLQNLQGEKEKQKGKEGEN